MVCDSEQTRRAARGQLRQYEPCQAQSMLQIGDLGLQQLLQVVLDGRAGSDHSIPGKWCACVGSSTCTENSDDWLLSKEAALEGLPGRAAAYELGAAGGVDLGAVLERCHRGIFTLCDKGTEDQKS